jgi:hypothetical protein
MEANSFISDQEIQNQIKKMITEQQDVVIFQSGRRVKVALVLKNTNSYDQYKDHLLQFDVTVDEKQYAIVCGVK